MVVKNEEKIVVRIEDGRINAAGGGTLAAQKEYLCKPDCHRRVPHQPANAGRWKRDGW